MFSPFRPFGALAERYFVVKWNSQLPVLLVYSNLLTMVIMRGIVFNSIKGVALQICIARDTGGWVFFFFLLLAHEILLVI